MRPVACPSKMCQMWPHLLLIFFFRYRTYLAVVLPAYGSQSARRSGSSTSPPEDLWKYRQPGYPHELQMTPRSVTRTNTFERNIVFTSGLCWKCCKIRIRSTCPVCPWMYGFLSFLAYVCPLAPISKSAGPQGAHVCIPQVRTRCRKRQSLCPPCPRDT
jgi:hypothetical protein